MSQAELARKSLIDQVLKKIRTIPSYSTFYGNTYYIIAGLGLQRKAKAEEIFENADWDNPECRNTIFERVKDFLMRYIK